MSKESKIEKEEEKDPKTFDIDSLAELDIKEKTAEEAQKVLEDIEERKNDTTKTGRKSKVAKDAETEEILVNTLQSVLTGFNALLVKYVGEELRHDEEEIKTISLLGAPVINKHVDIEALKYKEELALASYLMMAEMPKIDALAKRVGKEYREKKKKKAKERMKDAES